MTKKLQETLKRSREVTKLRNPIPPYQKNKKRQASQANRKRLETKKLMIMKLSCQLVSKVHQRT